MVGFGGSLPAGDLFAVILFTRTVVTAATADRFRTLALDVKGCLVPHDERNVFEAANVGFVARTRNCGRLGYTARALGH